MNEYLLLFFTSFCLVAIRAFQQLNVVHGRFTWLIPTSYCFAFTEIVLISHVAKYDNLIVTALFMGTGGWMGCYLSLALNGKLKRKF